MARVSIWTAKLQNGVRLGGCIASANDNTLQLIAVQTYSLLAAAQQEQKRPPKEPLYLRADVSGRFINVPASQTDCNQSKTDQRWSGWSRNGSARWHAILITG